MSRCARRCPAQASRSEVGAALVAVVLLALAILGLAHGVLAISAGELEASRAAARQLEARGAADAAVNGFLVGPGLSWLDSVRVGEVRRVDHGRLGRATSESVLRRLGAETWWLEGLGRAGMAEVRTGTVTWALDPLSRIESLAGAVTTAGGAPLLLEGVLDVTAPAATAPPLTVAACEPWRHDLEAHYAASPLAAVATLDSADTMPKIGRIDFGILMTEGFALHSSTGTPEATDVLSGCETSDPWNWGDPLRPWRPCGAYIPYRSSSSALDVVGGVGQAFLVVDGDLTLRDGATLYGLVVTTGVFRLDEGASFEGMAIAAGGLAVARTARFRASACWAIRTLAAQRATLGRLRSLPDVGRLEPLSSVN